jgi:hypothetical protein
MNQEQDDGVLMAGDDDVESSAFYEESGADHQLSLGDLHDALVRARYEGSMSDERCRELDAAARAARWRAGGLRTLRELTGWDAGRLYNALQEQNWARLVVAHGPNDVPLFYPPDVAAELAKEPR